MVPIVSELFGGKGPLHPQGEEGHKKPGAVEPQQVFFPAAGVGVALGQAEQEQGVTFLYPDTKPFQETCEAMHEEMLGRYPDLAPIYDKIQDHNGQHPSEKE